MTAAPKTTPTPRRGAVYDVGGALAIYWPDTHPCGPNRPEPWLILHDVGHTEWAAELSQGEQVSYLPGYEPRGPQTASNTPPSPAAAARRRNEEQT